MAAPRISTLFVLAALLAGCTAPAPSPSKVDLPDIHGLAIDPDDSGILYVATHGGLFRAEGDRDWAAVTEEPFDMMGFTMDPANGTMYASGHPPMGGLLGFARSTDRGETWDIISLEGQVDFHAMTVSLAMPDRVWGYWRGEVLRSDDGGSTWQSASGGVAPPKIASLASHAKDPGTLFAASSQGVYVSRDGGATFEPLLVAEETSATPSMPLADFTAIATSPADPQLVAAHRWQGMAISRDGGVTWSSGGLMMAPPTNDAVAAISIDPRDADTMYVGSYRGLVWKSVDGGGNWTVVL